MYNSKLKPLCTAFLQNIKLSELRMGMQSDKDPLAVELKNYLTKIVNLYIVYDLYAWPRNPTTNFKCKNCLFGTANIVKDSDKENYLFSGYGVTFDTEGSWSFDNDLLEMLQLLMLIIIHHLTLTIARKIF